MAQPKPADDFDVTPAKPSGSSRMRSPRLPPTPLGNDNGTGQDTQIIKVEDHLKAAIQAGQLKQRLDESPNAMVSFAEAFKNLYLDETMRPMLIQQLGMAANRYRADTHEFNGATLNPDANAVLGFLKDYLKQTWVKIMPVPSRGLSRLEKEMRRIQELEKINERIRNHDGKSYLCINLPNVLSYGQSSYGQNDISILIEEFVHGDRLYERLAKEESTTRKRRSKHSQGFENFWEKTIEHIVNVQAIALALRKDLIDAVHSEPHQQRSRGWDVGAQENADFYERQIRDKFIGTQELGTTAEFPGALQVVLDSSDSEQRKVLQDLRKSFEQNYRPVAYLLGLSYSGIDTDRSLWNIKVDNQGRFIDLDFETLTNSPHEIALANVTSQGIYFPNKTLRAPQDFTLEGELAIARDSNYSFRDKIRFHYCDQWNKALDRYDQMGIYQWKRMDLDEYRIIDFDDFRTSHIAAGVHRPLVHFATFIKTMRSMQVNAKSTSDKQEEANWNKMYQLARRGMEISLTHASDNILQLVDLLEKTDHIEEHPYQREFGRSKRQYIRGLRDLREKLRDLRQNLRKQGTRSTIRYSRLPQLYHINE